MSEIQRQTLPNKELRREMSALSSAIAHLLFPPILPSPLSALHPPALRHLRVFLLTHTHTLGLLPCPWCLLIARVHTRASLNALAFMSCLCWRGRGAQYCKLIRLPAPPFVGVCEVNYHYISPLSNSWPHPPVPSLAFVHSLFLVTARTASAWLNTGLGPD